MRKIIEVSTLVLTTFLTTFYFLVDIYTPFGKYSDSFFYLLLLYSFFLILLYSKASILKVKKNSLFILFIIFTLICFISAVKTYNHGYQSINYLIIVFTFITLVHLTNYERFVDIFLLSQIIGFIPILRFIQPMNTVGIISSYVGVMMFIYLKRNTTKNYFLYSSIAFIIFFVLIFISGSRTALLVYIFIGIYTLFIQEKKKYIRNIMTLLIGFAVMLPFFSKIELFLNKYFLQKWETADISSGRVEMWTFFSNKDNGFIKLWGNGNQLVGNFFKVTDVHNIYFQTLVQFGTLALIVLLILVFFLLKELITKKRIESLFFLWILLIGLFENVLIFNQNIIFTVLPFLVFLTLFSVKDKKGDN